MEKQPDLEFQRILENIRSHFDFLFQRDYRIVSLIFTDPGNQNWVVVLTSENCLIKIHCRNRKIRLGLSSVQLFSQMGLFDLHELIHLTCKEVVPQTPEKKLPDESEQLRTTAELLEQHMDEILMLFHRIYLGISFNRAGQLFKDNSPVFLFYGNDQVAHVAQA